MEQEHKTGFYTNERPLDLMIGGRFILQAQLARTAMSHVFRAYDCHTGTVCVVKSLAPTARGLPPDDALLAFLREAATLAQLDGPFPRLVTINREQAHWYMVQTYIEGQTLDAILEAKSLTEARALTIAASLIQALSLVHQANLIYGDLHPGNVMVQADGSVILLDMGLARPCASDPPELRGIGTPGYAAPEQYAGLPLDQSSDIYALSLVLTDLFADLNVPEVVHVVLAQAQEPLQARRRVGLADIRRVVDIAQRNRRRRAQPVPTLPAVDLRTARRQRAQQARIIGLCIITMLAILVLAGLALGGVLA
ncbi:serine/threonine-protein kinase [Candidatus Chloroploca asiatica]|uniref:non-specific serine/threonine protein kinase n=1 Tax=Candidatus Chloroploca asiatica TaxID=1506545 RepID=A0A2H3KL89_9CHLR|nr:serine/threonine-protein kinase [Candidatus Chloroploca asiatica]PDV98037.1 hypothetical protein A9Q02_02850 [Candidatus Chloroploca asiatica]